MGQDGNGGHAHNDTGSFELNYKGKDFIIDPGSYVYTADPKQRNKFRSIFSHSIFAIRNQEFNRFIKGKLFTLQGAEPPKVRLKIKKSQIIFSISYFDKKLKRIFKISPKNVKISDKVNSPNRQKLIQNLILNDRIKTNIGKNQVILSKNRIKIYLKIHNPKLEPIEISKAYNQKINSYKITNIIPPTQKNKIIEIISRN